MRWKQFFTPVRTIEPNKAKSMLDKSSGGDLNLVDVRQAGEYEEGHIPGATLIPLPELDKRLGELDSRKPTVVYCAMGGRSRVAAQMLTGKGFDEVYNLKGGYKGWKGETAFGPEDAGLHVFSGSESLHDVLVTAYSLEQGLREFYLAMQDRAESEEARSLFGQFAEIEEKHKDRIFEQYRELEQSPEDREDFESRVVARAMEGGMTSEEYLQRVSPNLGSQRDIVDLAMSIEGQALDLYQRAAERFQDQDAVSFLRWMSDEEKSHLARLGQLMDRLAAQ